MIVDTSAVIAMLFGEPEAASFAHAINASPNRRISAASWMEAALVADNRSDLAAAEFDAFMERLGLEVMPFTIEQARRARDAHRRFGKGRHPAKLNLGDCFSYALAQERNEPLLFKGDDFAQTDVKAAI
jgi:ribonuclease VapC